jgi:hypothetical protein
MLPLLAATAAADGPDEAARLSEYYGRRLRSNQELVERRWTVLEGGLALPSRTFAEKVGDDDGLRRLARHRRGWLVVAAVTGAAGVAWTASSLGPSLTGTLEPGNPSPAFALVAVPVAVALPAVAIHLAQRPRHAPVSAFYDEADANEWIEGYNRSLATSLALDPAAVP